MTNPTHTALRARVEAAAQNSPILQLTFRPMFGGHMLYHAARPCGSLAEQGLALKLSETDRATLLREPDAQPLQHDGEPPSKVYVVVPPHIIADDDLLRDWLERSATYVMTLPAPKPRKKKTA
ncbi:MAG: TfoX/Sxy family protein [Ktedonobacterales bacterium]|nr:TfoX/Sxy family protein [Ktedonobacterales bacterium]